MKTPKALIALILCAAMLIPMLVSCGKASGQSNETEKPDVVYETDSSVPADLRFEGEKFTILCREDNLYGNFLHEIEADESETDLVNQAVYERNLQVEEQFGIDLIAHDIPGAWAQESDFTNTFTNSILSGSGSFDLIMGYQAYMAEDDGYHELYVNYYDVPYIKDDLDNEYFYQKFLDEITVNDTLFYIVGDYSLTLWEYMYVMYFNKDIVKNENIEDIYQLVRDGKWTIDKCIELSKGIFRDLDGNGWAGQEDRFCFITDYENTSDALLAQFDLYGGERDENGNIVLNVDQGKIVSVLEKMIAFYETDDVFTFKTDSSMTEDQIPLNDIFTEGRALFLPDRLEKAQSYRSMETDFGIVPHPKWDENQENYLTQSWNAYSVAVIPMDAKNLEMSGAVLDILSELSYKKVIPAYYDMALKGKFARDNESGEMLDIIRESITVTFDGFFDVGIGDTMRVLLNQKNSNYVSFYAANRKGYERKIKQILKTFENNENE